MVRVITGDQADTPITHILTGIAGPGGTATGAIGRACHELGLPTSESAADPVVFASQSPATRERNLYRNFITLT
jgi:nicotinamide mononucleotide (NMN) deamidase PncC